MTHYTPKQFKYSISLTATNDRIVCLSEKCCFSCRIKFVTRRQCPGFDSCWEQGILFLSQSTKTDPGTNPFSSSGCRGSSRSRAAGTLLWPLTVIQCRVPIWATTPPLPFVPTQHVQGRTLPLLGDSIVFHRVFHGFKGISSIFVSTQTRCPVYSLCRE